MQQLTRNGLRSIVAADPDIVRLGSNADLLALKTTRCALDAANEE